ncbi:hypothetical protein Tco_1476535 [Tanacetum coccineum]
MRDRAPSTFSVEELSQSQEKSKDTFRSDSKNVLPSCDDFSSIKVPHNDSMTFSNPLFEFEVNFNSSDINPLFDEELEDIECKLASSRGIHRDPPFEENDDLFDLDCKTNDWKRILYDAPIDKVECSDPGGDNDEIDTFLAKTKWNRTNDTLITFSPKSDPLHYEFAGGVIVIPPRIDRKHEDYINRMSLLCGNSSSRSPKNFHTIIESPPISTTLVKDSDSNKEEIDIFSRPDDSIPPGIESEFDSKEDIIDNLFNDDPIPEYERLTFDMEPDVPVINNVYELNEDECFDLGEVRLMLKLTIPSHLSFGLLVDDLKVLKITSKSR